MSLWDAYVFAMEVECIIRFNSTKNASELVCRKVLAFN